MALPVKVCIRIFKDNSYWPDGLACSLVVFTLTTSSLFKQYRFRITRYYDTFKLNMI